MSTDHVRLLNLTTQIVSSYAGSIRIEPTGLPDLIGNVYRTLQTAGQEQAVEPAQVPAVPIKRSVFPDHIVCLEDGRKLKMLKRHLKTSFGLTPETYRAKWSLPHDYPMVARNYATKRSDLAKKIGLGRKPAAMAPMPAMPTPPPKATGRKGRATEA